MDKSFDPIGLHRLVDGIRIDRGASWARMAKEAGISASTMTRLSQGRSPDVNGLSAILVWSGLDANDVMGTAPPHREETMTRIRLALRDDENLSRLHAEAIGDAVQALHAKMSTRSTA